MEKFARLNGRVTYSYIIFNDIKLKTASRRQKNCLFFYHQRFQFFKNFGKADALSEGFKQANGDVVITIDADLQDDPAEIPRLIEKIQEGWDVVSGWKKDRKDPISKRLPSKLFNISLTLFKAKWLTSHGLKSIKYPAN